MSLREQVLEQALRLPTQDQLYVAQELENHLLSRSSPKATLEIGGEDLLPELQRRSAAYCAGLTTAREASDVIAELRQRQAQEHAP